MREDLAIKIEMMEHANGLNNIQIIFQQNKQNLKKLKKNMLKHLI